MLATTLPTDDRMRPASTLRGRGASSSVARAAPSSAHPRAAGHSGGRGPSSVRHPPRAQSPRPIQSAMTGSAPVKIIFDTDMGGWPMHGRGRHRAHSRDASAEPALPAHTNLTSDPPYAHRQYSTRSPTMARRSCSPSSSTLGRARRLASSPWCNTIMAATAQRTAVEMRRLVQHSRGWVRCDDQQWFGRRPSNRATKCPARPTSIGACSRHSPTTPSTSRRSACSRI